MQDRTPNESLFSFWQQPAPVPLKPYLIPMGEMQIWKEVVEAKKKRKKGTKRGIPHQLNQDLLALIHALGNTVFTY